MRKLNRFARAALTLAATALMVTAPTSSAAAHTEVAYTDAVSATVQAPGAATPPPPAPARPGTCEEAESCFNPCTMGVNGLHPQTDPRHWVPGPCDMASELPHERRFTLHTTPADTATDFRCAPEQLPTLVLVRVREATGSAVPGSSASIVACLPLAGGIPDASSVTPELFHTAAHAA